MMGDSARAEEFRRLYRPGDYVQGQLLSYVSTERAWVRIGHLTLVAAVRAGQIPATPLTFVVHALYPEILLSEAASASLGEIIQKFSRMRKSFETALAREYGTSWALSLVHRLQNGTTGRLAFFQVAELLEQIQFYAPPGVRVAYCPWLAPGLQESLFLRLSAKIVSTLPSLLAHGLDAQGVPCWVQTQWTASAWRTYFFYEQKMASSGGFPLKTPWEIFGTQACRPTLQKFA